MKICTHCTKQNPDDAALCYRCGNPMMVLDATPPAAQRVSFWKRIPSWGWILIFIGGIGLLLFAIVGSFWAMASVEGVASGLMLAAGILVFRPFIRRPPSPNKALRGMMIGFFALMGMAIDQPGNLLYNKPIEQFCCPTGSSLNRTTEVSHPLPGRTDMTQEFVCSAGNQPVERVGVGALLGIRFVEYVLLAYLLLGIRWLVSQGRRAR